MLSKLLSDSVRQTVQLITKNRSFQSSLQLYRNNILKFHQFSTSLTRNNLPRNVKEHKYKARDQVQEEFSLIYRAPMENYLSACNHVTSITCIIIGAFLVVNYYSGVPMNTERITYGGKLVTNETELVYFAIGFVAINVILRIMVSRYPLRIYKNSEKYLAVFDSQVPLRKTKVPFSKGDVTNQPATGVLPWRENRYKIKNRKVLLLIDYFKAPADLFEMMAK